MSCSRGTLLVFVDFIFVKSQISNNRKLFCTKVCLFSVSVQNSNQVKVTGFGLAKLVDYQEEENHSEGGRVCRDRILYTYIKFCIQFALRSRQKSE